MDKHIVLTHSDYCPEFDDERSISVEVVTVWLSGMASPQYYKTSFRCTNADFCEYLVKHGICPLFLSAPGNM